MSRLFTRPMPDWTDREAVAEFAAAGAEILGDDPAAARAIAARIWDRTPGTAPPVQMANQMGMVFPRLDCKPAGASACPRSRSPRSSSTAAATGSSPSATARRSPARSPGTAARPQGGLHCDPRCGGRRGHRGDAHARIKDGGCRAGLAATQQWTPGARSGRAPAIGTIRTRGCPGCFARSMSRKPTASAVSAPRPHDPTSKITIYGWSINPVKAHSDIASVTSSLNPRRPPRKAGSYSREACSRPRTCDL
jgi:hypothetical protein